MKWNEMGDDLAQNLTKRKIIWFGQLSLFRSSWNLCWYLIYHLYDKKLFSTQVLSTAQGPVQHSHAMTSAQSQLICGGEEVCPTLEMYLYSFRKLHLIHLHVKQIHSSLSEFLMNKLLFTRHPLLFNSQSNCLKSSLEEMRYFQLLNSYFQPDFKKGKTYIFLNLFFFNFLRTFPLIWNLIQKCRVLYKDIPGLFWRETDSGRSFWPIWSPWSNIFRIKFYLYYANLFHHFRQSSRCQSLSRLPLQYRLANLSQFPNRV